MHPAPTHLKPTRWTNPALAAAYSTRLDLLDRDLAWPAITPLITNPEPRHAFGRPDTILLELGSGPGNYAHHLADHHWTATHAVDTSPAMHRHGAARIRDAWIHRILPGEAGRLPLRRCQCTAALAHLLICHIPEPAHILAVLTEARRVLRPAAPLVLIEPGDLASDFQLLRYGDPDAAAEPLPGAPYPIDYTLPDATRLRTTGYRHSTGLLADLVTRAGFHLDDVRPLRMPAATAAPFVMWTARAA